jgi:hypothetical protein
MEHDVVGKLEQYGEEAREASPEITLVELEARRTVTAAREQQAQGFLTRLMKRPVAVFAGGAAVSLLLIGGITLGLNLGSETRDVTDPTTAATGAPATTVAPPAVVDTSPMTTVPRDEGLFVAEGFDWQVEGTGWIGSVRALAATPHGFLAAGRMDVRFSEERSTQIPVVLRSPDGIDWTLTLIGLPGSDLSGPVDSIPQLSLVSDREDTHLAPGSGLLESDLESQSTIAVNSFESIGDRVVLAGAADGSAQVWYSDDGVDWTAVDDSGTFPAQTFIGDITAVDGSFVAVGSHVWLSADGVEWTRHEAPGSLGSVAPAGSGMVAAGQVAGTGTTEDGDPIHVAAVWTSDNGVEWTPAHVDVGDPLDGSSWISDIVPTPTGLVAVGAGLSGHSSYIPPGGVTALDYSRTVAVVWASDDGTDWTIVEVGGERYNTALGFAAAEGGLIVAVGDKNLNSVVGLVWYSTDGGETWAQDGNPDELDSVLTLADVPDIGMEGVAIRGGRVVIAGMIDADGAFLESGTQR